eukprot:SAG11_NODE_20335_length_447_cov_2.922414_1_plen_37_part_10
MGDLVQKHQLQQEVPTQTTCRTIRHGVWGSQTFGQRS